MKWQALTDLPCLLSVSQEQLVSEHCCVMSWTVAAQLAPSCLQIKLDQINVVHAAFCSMAIFLDLLYFKPATLKLIIKLILEHLQYG